MSESGDWIQKAQDRDFCTSFSVETPASHFFKHRGCFMISCQIHDILLTEKYVIMNMGPNSVWSQNCGQWTLCSFTRLHTTWPLKRVDFQQTDRSMGSAQTPATLISKCEDTIEVLFANARCLHFRT